MTIRAIALLALGTIAACSQSTNVDESSFMPLAVGNRWIYSVDNGMLDTFEIVSSVTVNGEVWYVGNDSNSYCNRSNGLWTRRDEYARHANLPMPAVGDTVQFESILVLEPGTSTLVTQVLYKVVTNNDTTVSVPAGTFSCEEYHLRSTVGSLIHDVRERYAAGIGLVHGTYPTIMRPATMRTLLSYSLH